MPTNTKHLAIYLYIFHIQKADTVGNSVSETSHKSSVLPLWLNDIA